MRKQKKEHWILAAILIFAALSMLYFGSKKEGYHVDEIYSYGLANSEYLPFMHFGESGYDVKDWMLEYGAGESLVDLFRNLLKDFKILKEADFQWRNTSIYQDYLIAQENSYDTKTTTWVSGKAYQDYLCASESNTFNYASVYYNQRGDVHPPLYYILLHTICSLFQGTFSKWFGLSINIICLLLTLLILYRMIKRYLGGEKVALVTIAVYACSVGFMTSAMLIRMYALMTLMVTAFCYLHLKMAEEDFQVKGKNKWKLVLITLGGFLTHYYFVLYAIGVAAVFAIWMIARRKWKELLRYSLTMAATAAFGLCIWPFAIKHVFSGYRGLESLNTILSGEFYYLRIKLLLYQVLEQLMGGKWWILISIVCLIVFALIKNPRWKELVGKGALVVLPVLFYIVMTGQIIPYIVERYVVCTYPLWCFIAIGSVSLAGRRLLTWKRFPLEFLQKKKLSSERLVTIMIVAAGILLVSLNNCYRNEPRFLFQDGLGQELIEVPENTDCVYVLPDGGWNESAQDSLMLSHCRQVAIVYRSMVDCLKDTYEYQEGDYLMVAVQKDMNTDMVLDTVRQALGVTDLPEVSREYGMTVVRVLLHQE